MSATQQQLGDYLLLERLGDGARAGIATYRGVDRRDGRRVIVRAAAEADDAAAAVRREAEVLGKVSHANIARLIDSGARDGRVYCVLSREDGVTLDRLPAAWRAAMGQRTLLELLGPLLDALEAVHAAGVLHGDLSPRNILLRRDGTPVLIDFGAAATPAGNEGEMQAAAATPGFAAPERGAAGREGPWTDLYALAAVVRWLVVGEAPASAGAEEGNLARSLAGDRRFAPSFLAAVDRALAAAPEARPASAREWRAALFEAGPPERDEAPSLDQLAAALLEAPGIDLPAADEVPPTALIRPEASRRARAGLARQAAADPRQDAWGASRRAGRRVALAAIILFLGLGGSAAAWWGWTWYRDASKREWVVDPEGGGDALTIAEAVARAPEGATIRLRPGVYGESVAIARPLHLEGPGDGAAPAMIKPSAGRCVLFDAPTGSLKNLAFEGGGGAGPCVEVARGSVEIIGNRVGPWTGTALLIRDGATPRVRQNEFRDIDGTAIVIAGRGGGIIEDNRVERTTKSAIKVQAGANPALRRNHIAQAGQAGLLIEQGSRGHYSENDIIESGASAVEVRGGAAPLVAGNHIDAPAQSGLFIHEGARGEFTGNLVRGSGLSGVVVTGGAQPLLADNEIAESAQHGIVVVGGAGGRIAGNRIHDNQGHAIVLGGGQTAVVEDNTLSDNQSPQVRRVAQ